MSSNFNPSHAVFLVPGSDARAMLVEYEEGTPKKVFKTFDQEIGEGDFVVVPTSTRCGMTVVKVVEPDCDFDLSSSTEMDWIVCKVDRDGYEEILNREAGLIKAVRQADKRRRMAELGNALMEGMNEEEKGLLIDQFADSKSEGGDK
jgi:predicted Mrr-cat superfamily restriction endonuclease